ncbi:hypothetical protein V7S43_014917 [Phytophthora oleae]|uniref:HSF-type DNA-binding domain-containing protein n=1 Tax=Phytophthora oleae TaxID=2107226 RepID=A0ABD3F1Y3_9STRA
MDNTTPTNANTPSNAAFTAAPRFVRAVYDMLQNEDQRILSWSADGSHFQVYDVPRLETEVLRKYFKHGKFSSFQRQLNNFGFHKWTKTRASVATFSHDVLVRCHLSQLDGFASRMQLKQKGTRTTLVSTTTSAKRPRSLLSTGPSNEHIVDVKRYKMSPRDVCAVDELSDVSFTSDLESLWLLEEDGNYSSTEDMLLLDVLDSVELAALDWDAAVASPLAADALGLSDNDNNNNSNIDISIDTDASEYLEASLGLSFGDELDCEAVAAGLLTDLEISELLADCDLDALFGGTSI